MVNNYKGGRLEHIILFEDDNSIVINKPAGISMHGINTEDRSVTIASLFKEKLAKNDPIRGGVVHRLDKNTSGVVVLAKNSKQLAFLQSQFANREVGKKYLALVWGHMKLPHARLELPIKRSTKSPAKMAIDATGKMAVSEYKVIEEYKDYSLLELAIFTGRTHQIRVQLSHLGHPVVGDLMYGNKRAPEGLKRQFLHAESLTLKLNQNEPQRVFEAPLAKDLNEFLDKIDE